MTSTSPSLRTTLLLSVLARIGMHVLVFAILVGAWELLGYLGLLNVLLLPPPSWIIYQFYRMWFVTAVVHYHFMITLYEVLLGFAIGVGGGVALAIVAAMSPTVRRYLAPYIVVLNVTPGIAITPLVIAWFGFGISSKVALAAIVCFFPPFVNTLTGLLQSDKDGTELFRMLRANRVQYFWKLQLPNAMPAIMAGLKLGLTGAVLGAIVAEFTAASEGVGILMQRFAFRLDVASALATLLTMSLMGLMLFIVMEIVEDRVVFWKRDARLAAESKRRALAGLKL